MGKVYLFSLGMTLVLEVIFARTWGVKGKDFRVILLMNCLTNPFVVWWHYSHLTGTFGLHTLLPEISAMAVEMILLRIFCKNIHAPLLLGICINLFSYCLGSVILFIIQGG